MDCSNCSVSGVHFSDICENVLGSKSSYQKRILEALWEGIFGRKLPAFQNVEIAIVQLQRQLMGDNNLGELLFEALGYKIVLTIRYGSTVRRSPLTVLYKLPLLSHEYSLSLNGESNVAWEIAQKKSQRKSTSRYSRERIYKCLNSIDFLNGVRRECFLDLASFPAGKKVCADALLDIWIYVRKMERQDALILLRELASRNLLNLIGNQRSRAENPYESPSELFFSQCDVVRDLAWYMGYQDNLIHSKRLLMPRKNHSLPGEWELLRNRPLNAQIVSIHTGSMAENDWYEMNLPETEALVLHFSAREYCLPPFLKTMKKLKVLVVCNLGSQRATLKGLDALSSLTQLKSVRLERVVAPTILQQGKVIQNLDKLSLSLCQGFVKMSTLNDSNLHEFSLDHCSDLEELPPAICHMSSAHSWSVTNCHLVENLPYNLGNLSSLKTLRLSALPALKELPASIGKLEQLEFLDISLCEGLKELPEEIGQLKKLEVIDMRECSRLRRLPRSVCGLSSLKHVICDEKIGSQWLRAKAFYIPDLRVEIVEPQFTLDWLEE